MLNLRDMPGLPAADLAPPVVAEPGDPFASLRVVHLVARIPRGEPVRLRDIVDEVAAALRLLDLFIDTPFAGGRHQSRIDKLAALDQVPR